MDVAAETLDVQFNPIKGREDNILLYRENFTNYNQSIS